MAFGCPICSEKLEKLPAEAQQSGAAGGRGGGRREVNISATPCGHMFHAYCIQKWLTGNLASSRQCPCCRKAVPHLRCLSLFPTTYDDDTTLDNSQDQGPPPGEVVTVPCNHDEVIKTLQNHVKGLQAEMKEKDELHELLTSDYTSLEIKLRTEKLTSDTWMMRAKEFESYRDLVEDMEARYKRMELKLKTYTQLDSIMRGVEVAVQEDLVKSPVTEGTVRSLLEMKHVLSSELQKKERQNQELKEGLEGLRSEKLRLKVEHEKVVKDYKELKHIYEISRVNGKIRGGSSPVAGSSHGFYDDGNTPKAFRTKRRLVEPSAASGSASQETKESTAQESGEMDTDVDIFPLGKVTKKVKSSGEKPLKKKNAAPKPDKFPCILSPIVAKEEKETPKKSQNTTIILDSDSEEEEELRIRGNIPGAPLPISGSRAENIQRKAERPVLGKSSVTTAAPARKFKFKIK